MNLIIFPLSTFIIKSERHPFEICVSSKLDTHIHSHTHTQATLSNYVVLSEHLHLIFTSYVWGTSQSNEAVLISLSENEDAKTLLSQFPLHLGQKHMI